MYVEQKLVRCDACGRTFVVRYAFTAVAGGPASGVELRRVECPHEACGQPVELSLPVWARQLDAHVLPLGTPGRSTLPPRALAV